MRQRGRPGPHSAGPAAARVLASALVAVAFGVLAWSGAHWATYQLTDTHKHAHEHGLQHGHHVADAGSQSLAVVHGYLLPLTGASAVTLILAVLCLRLLPGAARPSPLQGRWSPLLAGVLSSASYVAVEVVEHAAATRSLPPVALLAVGALVQVVTGAVAAALARVTLGLVGRPLPRSVPVRPHVVRRTWVACGRRVRRLLLWLDGLPGRAPPRMAVVPIPS